MGQSDEDKQAIYDEAFAAGILDAPIIYDPNLGVTSVRIENDTLIEVVSGKDWKVAG